MTIAIERLQLTDSQRLGYYSTERTEFAVGEHVRVNYRAGSLTEKFTPSRLHTKLKGPIRVISFKNNTYELSDLITDKVKSYRVKDLHPFHFDPSVSDPLDIARRDYLEFFIDKVLDHRCDPRRKTSLSFLIQWMGYDSSYNSWESWNNFRDTENLHDNNMSKLILKKHR
jgi:hypothetical protein